MPEGDEARLLLERIWVNRRPARVAVFTDRLVLADVDGERSRAMRELVRVDTRRALGRRLLVLTFADGEEWAVRGLRAVDASVAYRLVVGLAGGRGA